MSAKISKFFKKIKRSKNSENLLKKSKSALEEQFITYRLQEGTDITLAPGNMHQKTPSKTSNYKGIKYFSKSILSDGNKTDKQKKSKNKSDIRKNTSCSSMNDFKITSRIRNLRPKLNTDIEQIYGNFSIQAGNNYDQDEISFTQKLSESEKSCALTQSKDDSSNLGLENYMTLATEPTKIDNTYVTKDLSLTCVTNNLSYNNIRRSMPNLQNESLNNIYDIINSDKDLEKYTTEAVKSTDSNDYENSRQSMPIISNTRMLVCEYCHKICKNKAGLSAHQRCSKDCKQIRKDKKFNSIALSP